MQNPEKPNSRDELLVTVAQTKLGPLELEVAENPSDRLLAVFLLDCSTSMAGPPIAELNQCVARLIDELREDPFTSITVDLAIVAFSSTAQLVLPPTAIRHLEPGLFTPLAAGGNTALGAAVDLAGKVIPERLKYYSRVGLGAYRPCVFVLSDVSANWGKIEQLADRCRVDFLTIGSACVDVEPEPAATKSRPGSRKSSKREV